jgi:hypothetical protein
MQPQSALMPNSDRLRFNPDVHLLAIGKGEMVQLQQAVRADSGVGLEALHPLSISRSQPTDKNSAISRVSDAITTIAALRPARSRQAPRIEPSPCLLPRLQWQEYAGFDE